MATIRDIAKRAGVAPSTVSAILNNRPECFAAEETRERVIRVAKELNYHPNRMARGLAKGASRLLGLMVMNVRHPVFYEIIAGVEDAASEAGYGLLLCCANDSAAGEVNHLAVLAENRVEGLVVVSPSVGEEVAPVLRYRPPGVPLAVLHRQLDRPGVTSLTIKNREALQQVTEHFIAQGHRRVAYLGGLDVVEPGRWYLQSSIDRRLGYLDAMAAHGLEPLAVSLTWSSTAELIAATDAMIEQLMQRPEPPTALACVSDHAATGAWRTCQRLGLRIPDDLALFGFDNLELAQYAVPPLSSVQQPSYEAGREAVKRVLSSTDTDPPEVVALDCRLVLRESSQYTVPAADLTAVTEGEPSDAVRDQ